MRWHKGLLPALVKEALTYSNTTQEILAIACDIPIGELKSFLNGAVNLSPKRIGVIKRALGITTPRDLRATRGLAPKVSAHTESSQVALLGKAL